VRVLSTVGSGQGRPLTVLLRLIRSAKIAALVAAVGTVSYVVFIVSWQVSVFLSKGDWPAVPVKVVLKELSSGRAGLYEAAATRGIGGSQMPFSELLQLPAIVPLLFATVLLTVFYLWLSHVEKQYLER
jgi:hypothetical protein